MKDDEEYIIDITKPPIFPPCRSIKCGLFGDFETKKSKLRTQRWKEYMEKYREALDARRSSNLS